MSANGNSFTLLKISAWLWQLKRPNAVTADPVKRAKIAEELADIVIYAMEFANIAELDVATIVRAKMEANAKKYPVDKARGRADKYTEL